MNKLLILLLALPMLLCACSKPDPGRFDRLDPFGEYDMWPVQQNGKWGFVDHTGQLIAPCRWDDVGYVCDGRAAVQKDGKWGAVDRAGKQIVACQWAHAAPEADGGYTVTSFSGYAGALAADGSVLIPCDRYTSVGPTINGARIIGSGDLHGLCTETGEVITPCKWRETGYFYDGLAWVIDETGARGYINMQGELVIPCQYSHAEDFVNGTAVVRFLNGNYQLIDTAGRYLFETAWPTMETVSKNELLKVRRDGKFGFVSRRGEVVIPPQYDYAQEFGDGLALVQQGPEIFWIDETGTRVMDRPEGYMTLPFIDGLAEIWNAENLSGLMDKRGHFVVPCRWEDKLYRSYGDEIFVTSQDDHTAFLNRQGELVTGKMYLSSTIQYGIDKEYLFLLEDGVLSVHHASDTTSP